MELCLIKTIVKIRKYTNINNTLPSFLQTSEFDNYKITLNSTLNNIINTNTSQDVNINNVNNTTHHSYKQICLTIP